MTTAKHTSPLVRATLRIEDETSLDGPIGALEPHIRTVFGTGIRGSVLRGDWLGHAVHPILTDAVIGSWTSATVSTSSAAASGVRRPGPWSASA